MIMPFENPFRAIIMFLYILVAFSSAPPSGEFHQSPDLTVSAVKFHFFLEQIPTNFIAASIVLFFYLEM